MARIIIFCLGMFLGFLFGYFVNKAIKLEKEPLIGDFCLIREKDGDMLYMNVYKETFLEDVRGSKYIRLKIDDTVQNIAD